MIKLPNSRHCFVCGLENDHGLQLSFYKDGPETIIANLTVPEHFQGYPGIVHGGIVAAVLDETVGHSLMINDPNRFMFTGKLTTRYRHPVPIGQPLRLVGTVIKDHRRLAESKAELYGPDDKLLADAIGLLVPLPTGTLEDTDFKSLGWKVYPDQEPVS